MMTKYDSYLGKLWIEFYRILTDISPFIHSVQLAYRLYESLYDRFSVTAKTVLTCSNFGCKNSLRVNYSFDFIHPPKNASNYEL